MLIFKGNLEIRAWIVLLVIFLFIGLVVYVFKITAKLRKYEKLDRSQSDISESISALASKLDTALEDINTVRKIKSDDKDSE